MEKTNCYNRTVGQEVLNKYGSEKEIPSLKNLIKELVRGIEFNERICKRKYIIH